MSAPAWRLIRDGAGEAAWNMSVDEALLLHAEDHPPTLRLYSWAEPTLSLGYRQPEPPWLGRAAALHVDVVRRVSGGGTVLHAGDLTYAVTARAGALPRGMHASYDWIRDRIVAGLRAAGFGDVAPARAAAGADRLELCFAGATGHEVELDGHKLVGSAQRRLRDALLQHGSIRLRDDRALYRALTGESLDLPPPPRPAADEDLGAAIVDAFERALGQPLQLAELSPVEHRTASRRASSRRREGAVAPPLVSRRASIPADRSA